MKVEKILANANALNSKDRDRFTNLLIEKRGRPRLSAMNFYAIMRSKGIALSHGIWYFRRHLLGQKNLAMPIFLLFGEARQLDSTDLAQLIAELTGE